MIALLGLHGFHTLVVKAQIVAHAPVEHRHLVLAGFGADGLDLYVAFWIADPENGTGNVRSEVNLAVLALLRREQVTIPYPQRVVHPA